MKIIGWKLVIFWDDDIDEHIRAYELPDWLADKIDKHLDEKEKEYET